MVIGKDNSISHYVKIAMGKHRILDGEGKEITRNENITIGQYVWSGMGTRLMAGESIGDGNIVGRMLLLPVAYHQE